MHRPTAHPRHAELVNLILSYLVDRGRSARWFGLQVAGDARLVSNLIRGQAYPPETLLRATERIAGFYEREALVAAMGWQAERIMRCPAPVLEPD